nr:unnamed protein product [Leishmania braziliensis]
MARRDRVPRHKSHTHKRNKNAKLSPFQREQKRAKMANQVPTVTTIGSLDSIPHSQRHIFAYLQEKRSRQEARRAALEKARQEQDARVPPTTATSGGSSNSSSRGSGRTSEKEKQEAAEASSATIPAAAVSATPAASTSKKLSKRVEYASLNDELSASVGAVLQSPSSRHGGLTAASGGDSTGGEPRSVEEVIARKKERKHRRKQASRRARIAAQLQEMEEALDKYAKTANGSGKQRRTKNGRGSDGTQVETADDVRERVNLAFERKLRAMKREAEDATFQRDAAEAAATGAHRQGGDGKARKRRRETPSAAGEHANGRDNGNGLDETAPQRQRKRISFNPDVEGRAAEAAGANRIEKRSAARKPRDFCELVDVVRYGERVEAPPVFDVVPNHNAAVSRWTNAPVRAEGRRGHGSDGATERHRLLAGGSPLAQQKRLACLGLAPAITHATRADGTAARMNKEEQIKALRDRVMATYQCRRRKEVAERKGVDMKHNFPQFA